MPNRFNGAKNKSNLVDAIASQALVGGNKVLARKLADVAKVREFAVGSTLISQDGHDNDLFLILSGEVDVVVNKHVVAQRKAKEHVGEMALIDPTAPRSATVKCTKAACVAVIKESKFTPIANKSPQMWRIIACTLGERLRERNKFIKTPNDNPMVFIASSTEGLAQVKALQKGIRMPGVKVTPWTKDIFGASKTTIESLEAVLKKYDFGIAVLTPDDQGKKKRGKGSKSKAHALPRDNVLFELGLLMGAFGRERTFIVTTDDKPLKIPSDLAGITRLILKSSSRRPIQTYNELKSKITSLGPLMR